MLIGINTWTEDKRFAEGLSFAIAFDTLLKLDPPPLRSPPAEAPYSAQLSRPPDTTTR